MTAELTPPVVVGADRSCWGRAALWWAAEHAAAVGTGLDVRVTTIDGPIDLSLMLSVWLGAHQAIGLSTWFGLLAPGAGATTYRVWWHFIANVIGSFIFAMALYHLWRERREIKATYTGGTLDDHLPDLTTRRRAAA